MKNFKIGSIKKWGKMKIKILDMLFLNEYHNNKQLPQYKVADMSLFIIPLNIFPPYATFWLWEDEIK